MVKKEKVATGEEALSLLESVPARAQFLNELSEVMLVSSILFCVFSLRLHE